MTAAVKPGLLERNPVRPKMFAKENNERKRFLTEDEQKALRKALGENHWPIVAIAIGTGLRQSEQFSLRWENVDFCTGIITVPRSKSGGARYVPMNDDVRRLLGSLGSLLRSPYVFPSETGETPIDPRNYMNRVFNKALRAAKIEGFRWHDLRHTFASRLVMTRADLPTVQQLLGHKTITMTLRYSHLSADHLLEAVQRLNERPTGTSTAPSDPVAETSAEPGAQVIDFPKEGKWRRAESNCGPRDYETLALAI